MLALRCAPPPELGRKLSVADEGGQQSRQELCAGRRRIWGPSQRRIASNSNRTSLGRHGGDVRECESCLCVVEEVLLPYGGGPVRFYQVPKQMPSLALEGRSSLAKWPVAGRLIVNNANELAIFLVEFLRIDVADPLDVPLCQFAAPTNEDLKVANGAQRE